MKLLEQTISRDKIFVKHDKWTRQTLEQRYPTSNGIIMCLFLLVVCTYVSLLTNWKCVSVYVSHFRKHNPCNVKL